MRTDTVRKRSAVDAVEVVKGLVDWESAMGGWEAPCWGRARAWLRRAEGTPGPERAAAGPAPREAAQRILDAISTLLFYELTPGGIWKLNPDKVWSPDTLDEIARLARPTCRGCDGVGTLAAGQFCDECEGNGLAPDDWREREDYA